MNPGYVNPYLFAAGLATAAAGLVHLMIPLGGPSWYALFGAPRALVRKAEARELYPTLSCMVIATLLFICAAYAFSGASLLPVLPLLQTGLTGIAAVFLLRGIGFVALEWVRPGSLAKVSGNRGMDAFLVVSSLICLSIGALYLMGILVRYG